MENKPLILLILIVLVLAFLFNFARNSYTPYHYQKTPAQPSVQPPAQNQNALVIETPQQLKPEAADSGEIEAEVMEIRKKGTDEFARVRIKNIVTYSRNPFANFDAAKADIDLELFLQWGSGQADPGLIDAGYPSQLPGLKSGSKFRGNIAGCPGACNNGKGWTLYLYKSI